MKMSYDKYMRQILKFLLESGGRALRNNIEKELTIPKVSMTNVKDEMVSKGLIKVLETFQNKTLWEITLQGKKFYQYGEGAIPEYHLPSVVEEYLAKKPNFKSFRPIQETFMRRGLLSSNINVSVFGPPAAGKTLIAEMIIMDGVNKGKKILYGTPYKALDRQKFKDFQTFEKLGHRLVITDGDNPHSQEELNNAPIIIATYERALGALSAGEKWVENISLFCADEITLLGEDRGATIDSLLTLLMTEIPFSPRIITLSSHVGNKFQIADWLHAEPVIEDIYHNIEEFIVYEDNGHMVLWSKNGNKEHVKIKYSVIEDLVAENAGRNETTLVFVNTRWEAEAIAKILKKLHERFKSSAVEEAAQNCLHKMEEQTPLVRNLCELLKFGVAFHHAGLPMETRALVEDLLQERKIKTVVCTTTLSHGIDYPVDNVIVFLTGLRRRWELDAYVCVQLEGRAGRPGKSQADEISGKGRAFLVAEKENATECMEKYIFGKPETIMPDTLSEENLGQFVLLLFASKRGEKTIDDIVAGVKRSFGAVSSNANEKHLRSHTLTLLKDLEKNKLLMRLGNKLKITDLGKFINTINISPHDAQLVLDSLKNPRTATISFGLRKVKIKKSKNEFSDFGLLQLASCIDVAKRVRDVGSSFPVRVPEKKTRTIFVNPNAIGRRLFTDSLVKALVLNDWIEEVNLGEIGSRFRGYHDQDVYQLGTYASRSLTKISKLATMLKMNDMAKRAEELAVRCRFGVKHDLAHSKIVYLNGIGRVRGRRLLESHFDLKRLAEARPSELTLLLGDAELQKSVVEQARELGK